MCYFLYGAVNKETQGKDLAEVQGEGLFHFSPGTREEVQNCGAAFRITGRLCDCNTGLGAGPSGMDECQSLAALIEKMRPLRGIKYLWLSKIWAEEANAKKISVSVDEVDLPFFLSEIQANCLYQIGLYKKYR